MSSPIESIDPVVKPFQGVWEGESKILLGIDVGTTQSGVTFAFLHEGEEQTMHRVTRWPGQEEAKVQSKVPTLVWYDLNGKAVCFGAEALSPQAEEEAIDNKWQLARHFKMHLHPNEMKFKHNFTLDPLPAGVSLRQIYSDFLEYLLKHVQKYFEDRIIDGKMIWEKYYPQMEVVIAHPNGWGIREQTFLRTVAVQSGLVSQTNAMRKVRFLTEAEASVHFCMHNSAGSHFQPRTKFAVCDAGGSTVDTTVYSVVAARPTLKLQETRASACVQAGGVFVDAAAKSYLERVLTNALPSEEDPQECINQGVKDFESGAKRSFRDVTVEKHVQIGDRHLTDASIRTRRGRMTLSGDVVKTFFDACVDEIVESVDQQIQGADVSFILLVGGFGDSPFLRKELTSRYDAKGCKVTLTNELTAKAVADGALIWGTISSVVGRATRSAFGVEVSVRNNSSSPEFQGRDVFICPSGQEKVHGGWSQIVGKGVVFDTEAVVRESFSEAFSSPNPDLGDFKLSLISCSKDGVPRWVKNNRDTLEAGFKNSCTITASLANLSGALEPRIGTHGSMYWRLYFDVCMRFGATELEAFLEWEENGTTHTGKVDIALEDVGDV